MVWFQKFEYAVSHWLLKATEDKLGCVLCSPGCFSLLRGSSLMDENVLDIYKNVPAQAREHIQYDQGKNRFVNTHFYFINTSRHIAPFNYCYI